MNDVIMIINLLGIIFLVFRTHMLFKRSQEAFNLLVEELRAILSRNNIK